MEDTIELPHPIMETTEHMELDESVNVSPSADDDIHATPLETEHQRQKESRPYTKSIQRKHADIGALAVCASPSDVTAAQNQKKHRDGHRRSSPSGNAKDITESLASMLRKGIEEHQIGLTVNLVLLVALSWVLFPSLRSKLTALTSLSYPVSQSGTQGSTLFGQGPRDFTFVLSFIVLFSGLRAFMLDYVLGPLGAALGIRRQKMGIRFAEQSYLLLYYSVYWCWGVYLFIRDTPAALPPDGSPTERLLVSLWTGFPKLYLAAGMKLYYLSQLAFWAQQIVVIHLEERRKDHYQMLTHHFFTVALMMTSYGFRQCRVGNAVLIVMDVVDLIFPLAKVLRYLGMQKACDAAFALFVVVWLAARHGAYLTICWSIYAHVNVKTMFYGTYSLVPSAGSTTGNFLSPDGGENVWRSIFQPFLQQNAQAIGFNSKIRWGFLALLLGLQVITLMWFVMICRVVARVLRGEGADDSRSDDEGEDEDEEAKADGPVQPSVPFIAQADEKPKFIEVEASADDLTYTQPRRAGSGSKRKSKGISSGLNLGERKDILNRIGCLSEEQLARERERREGSEGPRPGSSASPKR